MLSQSSDSGVTTTMSMQAQRSSSRMPLTSSGHDRRKKKKELDNPREHVIVAGAFPLYMAVFVWRLHRDRFSLPISYQSVSLHHLKN